MDDGEVVLLVRSLVGQGANMVDLELTLVEKEVYPLIADEARFSLSFPQPALERCALVLVQSS
jgi:hypothetical protein